MSSTAALKENAVEGMAEDLYRVMPGAPPVPFDDKVGWLWGEVKDNQHYQFCRMIAERVVRWSWNAQNNLIG